MACAALSAQADTPLRLVSNVIWSLDDRWFGGFSGIVVSDNGRILTVVSDRGRVVTARMLRNGGTLSALQILNSQPLRRANGRPLSGVATDAEGLAVSAAGRYFVSFENRHRVMELDPRTGNTSSRMRPPPGLAVNTGIEALAIHPDGTLHAIPEGTTKKRAPFPLYAMHNGAWQVISHIPRSGPFRPVGADFAQDGRLYLLERTVGLLGFRTRIRRFDLTVPDLAAETLLTTGPGRFDNMEGLSVWVDDGGQTHITMISDDNFLAIESTQIVEFAVTD